ncbi:MAG: hypothetical protein INQ03_03215 [Candidatus Heimdallarchaeota archaeon]|nr:hypothetical protein [Candidatus Heimdallarchaeota archaeon]
MNSFCYSCGSPLKKKADVCGECGSSVQTPSILEHSVDNINPQKMNKNPALFPEYERMDIMPRLPAMQELKGRGKYTILRNWIYMNAKMSLFEGENIDIQNSKPVLTSYGPSLAMKTIFRNVFLIVIGFIIWIGAIIFTASLGDSMMVVPAMLGTMLMMSIPIFIIFFGVKYLQITNPETIEGYYDVKRRTTSFKIKKCVAKDLGFHPTGTVTVKVRKALREHKSKVHIIHPERMFECSLELTPKQEYTEIDINNNQKQKQKYSHIIRVHEFGDEIFFLEHEYVKDKLGIGPLSTFSVGYNPRIYLELRREEDLALAFAISSLIIDGFWSLPKKGSNAAVLI